MDVNEMQNKLIKGLEEQTGHPLSHWVSVAKKSGLEKHKQILNHLKDEHGLKYGHANIVAFKTLKTDPASIGSPDELVDAMYRGKESLRPIYDQLAELLLQFGDDVELAPKKSYVSLRRKKQFGLIQPSTKTRVDVGINIKGKEPDGALEASGSFNSMVSHRVRLESTDDINESLIGWLKEAYTAAG